jgi:proteasome activator subunit 4
MHTDAYILETPRVDEALLAIEPEFSSQLVNKSLLQEAMGKSRVRIAKRGIAYSNTVCFSHTCPPRFTHSVYV